MESLKEYELRARIEQLGELLTIAKKNKTVKDATEDYYLTPEGAAVKTETEAKMEQTEALFHETKEHVISTINAKPNKCIGAGWRVFSLSDSSMEIGITDPEKPNKLIFRQRADLYYERRICGYDSYKERFELNAGTCGSHDLLPEELTGSFANFYICIGKFYSNIEFLAWLKDILFGYADRCK